MTTTTTLPNPADHIETASPMMKQYWAIKQQHPHALLLFRMGDFYECFFEDAKQAAKLLGVVQTTRGVTKENVPIPMAGVPFHAIEQYLAKLVKLGVSAVIAEQYGEPGKGLLDRRVTRVITPGTVTESEWIGAKEDSILAAVFRHEDVTALAWLNLSSGVFKVEQPVIDLDATWARLQPTEVLYADNDQAGRTYPNAHAVPGFWFDPQVGAQSIKQRFDLTSLDTLGLHDAPSGTAAAGVLLRYVHDTQGCIPPHLAWPTREHPENIITMDSSTRRNLELSTALHGGEQKTLWGILDTCHSAHGSRLLKRWIHRPERAQAEARTRLDAVRSLQDDPQDRVWAAAIDQCGDIERISARISLGTATPKDIAGLRNTLRMLPVLRAGLLQHSNNHRLNGLARSLEAHSALESLLEKQLDEHPRTMVRDGGIMRGGFDTELDECRALVDNAGDLLATMEKEERDSTGITTLRIEFHKNVGYAIEVTHAQVAKVPVHYQRRQTLKNVERYTTPALRTFEEKALSAKERGLKREKVLFDLLAGDVQGYLPWIQSMGQALAQLDVLVAFADAATTWNYKIPHFSTTPGIAITNGRHPVVERHVKQFVPNSLSLDESTRTWVVTGPNMGGKSTLMRQTALVCIMAYIGCPVPAEAMTVGPLDAIATRIGASDDVAGGRSTFMLEMEEAAYIVRTATSRTLVIMDEIGRGTSALDGMALAQGIVERLHRTNGALTLFATHYHALTGWAQNEPGVENWHMEVDDQYAIVFKHTVKPGPAARSYGVHVAALAGMPEDVLTRANQLMVSQVSDTPAPIEDGCRAAVLTLDINSLSPKDAWLWLERMQQQLLKNKQINPAQ